MHLVDNCSDNYGLPHGVSDSEQLQRSGRYARSGLHQNSAKEVAPLWLLHVALFRICPASVYPWFGGGSGGEQRTGKCEGF